MNMRTKLMVTALALVFAAGLFGAASVRSQPAKTAPPGKGPKAVIDVTSIQVGDVLESQDIEYTFKVRNEGDAELQILNVHPGCGCSVADYDKTVAPGKTGMIHVKINGKKIFPGTIEKNFAVKTNDPKNDQFTLVVRGTVRRGLDFSREMRWAGFTDETFKLDCIITNLLPTAVNIQSARWESDSTAKALEGKVGLKLETMEKGKKYRLTIWRKTELPPENFVTNVVLATDYPKLKEKFVPVAVSVMSDIELHPEKLYFGEMALPPGATTGFTRSFSIVAARGDSLKILKTVPSRDDMTVKIQELIAGKSYRGTVLVRPTSKIVQYEGSIKIYTNYPKCRELTLGVVGSVNAGDASGGKK
ncbi:MAG: DUF1573 domain-containing protein [Candidatus Krumholzibacteriaceae bacterium]|jgi:hypothetical protein